MFLRIACVLSIAALAAGCKRTTDLPIGCNDFGVSAAAIKVETFLDASAQFASDADALADGVNETCDAMLTDLGVAIPVPAERELQVEASCNRLAAEIESIVTAAVPDGATLVLTYEPAVCSVDVDAQASCVAECDANVEADVEVMCTEGRLVGRCTGMCSGECRVEGEVECMAECRGTCTGSCSGQCTGRCEGTCTATDSEGNCVGTCEGTCEGTCSATCTGTCEGSCVADVEGTCTGTCAGTCDVDFEAPRCEGDVDVEADVQCEAACEAHLRAEAECTEPRVDVDVSAEVDLAAQQRLADLIGVLARNWPAFLAATARLSAAVESGQDLAVALDGLTDATGELGAGATACVAQAVLETNAALANVSATVDVTVTVSASVTVEGQAGP
jgi:hypothetical protein